jgi:hypothetical protein
LNPDKESDDYNSLSEEYPKNAVFYTINDLRDFVEDSVGKFYNVLENEDQLLISNLSLSESDTTPYLWPKFLDETYKD